jgi:hydrogenase maturation protease
MKPVFLIIGYGNTLRSDDGLGPYVIDELRKSLDLEQGQVRLLDLPQLDPVLLPEFMNVDILIFIDVRYDESDKPILLKQVAPSPESISPAHTTHHLKVPELLRLAKDWYDAAPECYMVLMKGYDFTIGEQLSTKGLKAAEQARKLIIKMIHTGEVEL